MTPLESAGARLAEVCRPLLDDPAKDWVREFLLNPSPATDVTILTDSARQAHGRLFTAIMIGTHIPETLRDIVKPVLQVDHYFVPVRSSQQLSLGLAVHRARSGQSVGRYVQNEATGEIVILWTTTLGSPSKGSKYFEVGAALGHKLSFSRLTEPRASPQLIRVQYFGPQRGSLKSNVSEAVEDFAVVCASDLFQGGRYQECIRVVTHTPVYKRARCHECSLDPCPSTELHCSRFENDWEVQMKNLAAYSGTFHGHGFVTMHCPEAAPSVLHFRAFSSTKFLERKDDALELQMRLLALNTRSSTILPPREPALARNASPEHCADSEDQLVDDFGNPNEGLENGVDPTLPDCSSLTCSALGDDVCESASRAEQECIPSDSGFCPAQPQSSSCGYLSSHDEPRPGIIVPIADTIGPEDFALSDHPLDGEPSTIPVTTNGTAWGALPDTCALEASLNSLSAGASSAYDGLQALQLGAKVDDEEFCASSQELPDFADKSSIAPANLPPLTRQSSKRLSGQPQLSRGPASRTDQCAAVFIAPRPGGGIAVGATAIDEAREKKLKERRARNRESAARANARRKANAAELTKNVEESRAKLDALRKREAELRLENDELKAAVKCTDDSQETAHLVPGRER